jgi:hypothetical protein
MGPPSPESTGRVERGRATRQFWASPVVTVDDVDDWVAGCSPQFRAAQLRSQNRASHATACHYAGYDPSKQHRTSEQLRSGGKCVSYTVQTHAHKHEFHDHFRISRWRGAIRNVFKVFVVLTERLARN